MPIANDKTNHLPCPPTFYWISINSTLEGKLIGTVWSLLTFVEIHTHGSGTLLMESLAEVV